MLSLATLCFATIIRWRIMPTNSVEGTFNGFHFYFLFHPLGSKSEALWLRVTLILKFYNDLLLEYKHFFNSVDSGGWTFSFLKSGSCLPNR